MRREFTWNAVKDTDRKRRQFQSLSTFFYKIRYMVKVTLIKA